MACDCYYRLSNRSFNVIDINLDQKAVVTLTELYFDLSLPASKMSDEAYMHDDIEMDDSDDDLDEGNDSSHNMIPDDVPPPVPEHNEEDAAVARRRAIQAIMRDKTLSEEDRRMQIQNLMSGGRTEVVASAAPVIPEQESNTCVHYERNCNIVAPCCDQVFGCRVCHDEISPSGHPPMNRFLIRFVICKHCNTRQDAG